MPESTALRFALIVAIALGAHAAAVGIRALSRRVLATRMGEAKVRTVTGFATSVVVFAVYFAAFGFLLSELGLSLTTYLASASVIGLAVSFGSQGMVQDVINGLTVVFSDLTDVGDMVEIGGQVGIIESIGMRFTVLVNFSGAHVFVPNRSIANVVNYPQGYVRVFVDARLPSDTACHAEARRRLADLASAAYEQYPGILLLPPTLEEAHATRAGYAFLRVRFRIWPGQAGVIESAVRPAVIQAMRQLDASYLDWMVSVHHRAEPIGGRSRALPRPAALEARR